MKIVNSEIFIPKVENLTTEYFEDYLKSQNIDFLRWAIVDYDEQNFKLNVSHKV